MSNSFKMFIDFLSYPYYLYYYLRHKKRIEKRKEKRKQDYKLMIERSETLLKKMDERNGTNLKDYLIGMMECSKVMEEHTCDSPENIKASGAACDYLNLLNKYIKECDKLSDMEDRKDMALTIKPLFEIGKICYFSKQNEINKKQYPSSLEEVLKT